MSKFRVGFSTSSAWYSRCIRWFTKAQCSHAFLISQALGVVVSIEEGTFGYGIRTLSNMESSGSRVVQVLETSVDLDEAVAKSFQWLGSRYDYAGLIGMSWVMLCRWLGKKVRNPLASSHSMFCSESVTRVLQLAKYPGADALDPSSTDPETLRKFLIATGAVEVGP